MRAFAGIATLALGLAWAGGADALTLTLSGVDPGDDGSSNFLYGATSTSNNVVNSGSSGLKDLTPGLTLGDNQRDEWYLRGLTTDAKATVTLGPGEASFGVDWFFAGGESNFTLKFTSGAVTKTETNENHNCGSCVPGASPGPSYIGTTLGHAPGTVPFTVSWGSGSVSSTANSFDPSIMYAYVEPTGRLSWVIVDYVTNWFAFGIDDGGSDDNHDDYMGVARVFALDEVGNEVPIPAALPLFASAIVGGGLFGSRRARAFGSRLFSKKA